MKSIEELKKNPRIQFIETGKDGGIGYIVHPVVEWHMTVIFSNALGWDHVSVSRGNQTPTWEEMCIVKDIFFREEECVVQYHPPKTENINNNPHHPYVLHLWRPQNQEIPMPQRLDWLDEQ